MPEKDVVRPKKGWNKIQIYVKCLFPFEETALPPIIVMSYISLKG